MVLRSEDGSLHCNHELTAWLDEKIGSDYRKDATKLEKLLDYVNDEETLKSLLVVKQKKERGSGSLLKRNTGTGNQSKFNF